MQRAPTPKNERPSVTIANLERENDNLVRRISDISSEVNRIRDHRDSLLGQISRRDNEHSLHVALVQEAQEANEAAQAKIAKLESVLCGYRQAIADVHGHNADVVAK